MVWDFDPGAPLPDIEDRKPATHVPCTCMSLGCGLESYKDENHIQHWGKLVAKSTWSVHRKRDIDRAMPQILNPSPQVEVCKLFYFVLDLLSLINPTSRPYLQNLMWCWQSHQHLRLKEPDTKEDRSWI